jgi:hypothetical protein
VPWAPPKKSSSRIAVQKQARIEPSLDRGNEREAPDPGRKLLQNTDRERLLATVTMNDLASAVRLSGRQHIE